MREERRKPELLDLEDVERRVQPFQRHYIGVRTIPLDQVVGTDGRAKDFDRSFKPLRSFSRARLKRLSEYPHGELPPITVYKLGDTYFVIDGHHRVALARRHRAGAIDAEVTELKALVPLPPGADIQEVILTQLERVFLEDSGLGAARPGLRVAAMRPAAYLELLENVQIHGYHLMRERDRVLPAPEIAAHWYETVFEPTLAAIERGAGRPAEGEAADQFLWLYRRRRDLFPDCGCPPLEEVAREAAAAAQPGLLARVRGFTTRFAG